MNLTGPTHVIATFNKNGIHIMPTDQMEECGRCGRTIHPESEETNYCGECSSYFCEDHDCLCHDDDPSNNNHLEQT